MIKPSASQTLEYPEVPKSIKKIESVTVPAAQVKVKLINQVITAPARVTDRK